jgi:4-alpha-glucanotransferase
MEPSEAKPTLRERQAGILLHPSSLPGRLGIGDLGAEARRFVDWLARAGARLWQVLPLCPPGDRFAINPYVSWSALAGNAQLLSLQELFESGLLDRRELDGPSSVEGVLDRGPVREFKAERIRSAARRLLASPGHPLRGAQLAFRARAAWVEETALYAAVKTRHGGAPWWIWPEPLRRREPAALAEARFELEEEIAEAAAEQFLFDEQWHALRRHCRERGVRLLGDVPIYVSANSADVWLHQDLFQIGPDGSMDAVSGCPPDVFSARGQKWGHPLYRWDRMASDGYAWWRQRLARALEQVDFVRIDHFRAFAAYWEVPAREDPAAGRWVPGPGLPFFEAMRAALGELPLCVEDLGFIDDGVHALREETGLPGMRIVQHGFGSGAANPHLPHNHVERCVVYPGNHDNPPLLGWWSELQPHERSHVQHYLGRHGDDIVWDMIRAALASVGSVAVVQAQDLLVLGNEARMNEPGSYARLPPAQWRNWLWRMKPGALGDWHAARFRQLCELYGRA